MLAWLRFTYRNRVRLFPGGPVVSGRWVYVPEDSPRYLDWHRLHALAQTLQLKNPEGNPANVGELSPDDEGEGDFFQEVENRYRPKFKRPYASVRLLEVTGDGPHGTPAAFRMEPELNGEYWAKVWQRSELTDEEFDALPDCVRQCFESDDVEACDLLLIDDDNAILYDDETALEIECPSDACDLLLIDDDNAILYDDETALEISCPND